MIISNFKIIKFENLKMKSLIFRKITKQITEVNFCITTYLYLLFVEKAENRKDFCS